MWLIVLSDQLPIVALVSPYPTNQLIGHGPNFQRLTAARLCFALAKERSVCGIVGDFSPVFLTGRQVTHVLLTRPPLPPPLAKGRTFDLHVLGTPPAFILSQDQTRHPKRKKARDSRGVATAFIHVLGELRSRPSCCSCCPLLGCSQMLLTFVPSRPMERRKRPEGCS